MRVYAKPLQPCPTLILWTIACQAPVHGILQARMLEWVVILGTIAGDDTVLIVMRDTNSAAAFCSEIRNIIE